MLLSVLRALHPLSSLIAPMERIPEQEPRDPATSRIPPTLRVGMLTSPAPFRLIRADSLGL